ncbi:MAG: hypothetical protein JSW38_02725 [Dehalococcoidia bacterium]|nr:MAG: hypothetical protein JSW38_02725 [Dehalococcoidia bacterium]
MKAEVVSLHSENGHTIQDIEVKLQVTLKLNEDWVSNQTTEQLIESIKAEFNSSLGLRGQVKALSVITRK